MSGLAHYRRLLRSAKYAFGRDKKALQLAGIQLRSEFLKNKHVADPKVLTTLYKDVDDVDEMLRYHIVQGVRTDEGTYAVSLKPEHHATIEAEQDRQFGPELTPIDPSFRGSSVGVTKVKPCSSQRVAPKDLGDVTKN